MSTARRVVGAADFYHGLLGILVLLLGLAASPAAATRPATPVAVEQVVALLDAPAATRQATLAAMAADWHPGYAAMLVELLTFERDPAARRELLATLAAATGEAHGHDLDAWYDGLWARPASPHPSYARFKSLLYRQIDPRFAAYFADDRPSLVRLDEVRWGGVHQDGIPPLRSPRMLAAGEAGYLADGDLVFGLEIGGDARAYPQRILGWHELFTDTVGGVAITGVYCTLCGTLVVFASEHRGVLHELGTSGFLYRSNKLMYDRATQSLWSTIQGRPVIGPLVGRDIELERYATVTTRWGEWRRRHPTTRVLSLDTGHRRDYSEGAAYRDYFASDELMFGVPERDRRLADKAEVLTLLGTASGDGRRPALAIAIDFLARRPVHHERLGDVDLVILTDPSAAQRVYRTDGLRFVDWDGDRTAVDAAGTAWQLEEAALVAADGRRLPRFPASRAFWFGWFAAFPETRLVGGR